MIFYPHQHVCECLCALAHFQDQQEDLIEEQLNHQRKSWFEEERAATNNIMSNRHGCNSMSINSYTYHKNVHK